jgi:hypothetical protein
MQETHPTMSDDEPQAAKAAISDWETCLPYGIGDLLLGKNPLTRWDRVRMFFGFERASSATGGWVVETHSADIVECELTVMQDGWKLERTS